MILTDNMLEAAFNFREAEPWKELTDSDIFAVKLQNGNNAYCLGCPVSCTNFNSLF